MLILKKTKFKSTIATALAAALITTSPGLFSYQAFARVASGSAAAGRTAAPGQGLIPALSAPGATLSPLNAVGSLEMGSSLPVLDAAVIHQTPVAQAASAVAPAAIAAPKTQTGAFATKTPAAKAVAAPKAAPRGMSELVAAAAKRFAPALAASAAGSSAASPQAALTLRREFDGAEAPRGATADAVAGKNGATRSLLGRSAARANAADKRAVPRPFAHDHDHGPTTAEGAKKTSPLQWAMAGASAATIIGVTVFSNVSLVPIFAISGALLLSILAHESAHILGLRIWGDPTPKQAGRDHINPLMHIDPIGTILVPAASLMISQAAIGFPLLFGWAKPVPVDFNNLAEPKAKNAAKVAVLGPLMNLALAGLALAAAWALPAAGIIAAGGAVATVLSVLWKMNLALFAFNLLPLPWLDGGKLLVSMFPKNLYARWTANPNLPSAYQGIFKKIYEGPANVLSRFHVHSMGQINGITRVLTLGALGAFYAVFFSALQIPFLFLALPCSYDYWCIREKVRSEQAVEEMMDLMSEWGAALAQIAEDHDAESEVSTFEAEHAMKNAVDYLLEDLMAKEEFRNLSEEDKIKEFMKHYPDWATRYLKDKVFTEDTEEKIREILADERNTPFMKRLEEWLKTHKVFEKMASPHAKKKYKDASEEADEDRKRTMGGFLPLTMLPSVALGGTDAGVFTGAFEFIASLGLGSAMLAGTTSRGGAQSGPADKITRLRGEEGTERTLILRFENGITEEQAREAAFEESLSVESVETVNGTAPVGEESPSYLQLRVSVPGGHDLPETAARLAQRPAIKKLVMHERAMERAITRAAQLAERSPADSNQAEFPLEGAEDPAAPGTDGPKIVAASNSDLETSTLIVHFEGKTVEEARAVIARDPRHEQLTIVNARGPLGARRRVALRVQAPNQVQAVRVAQSLADSADVLKIAAHPHVVAAALPAPAAETTEPSGEEVPHPDAVGRRPAPVAADVRGKMESSFSLGSNRGRFDVHFAQGTTQAEARALIQRLGMNGKLNRLANPVMGQLHLKAEFTANDAVTAVRMASRLAREESVHKVSLQREAANLLRLNQRSPATEAPATEETAAAPAQEDAAEAPQPEIPDFLNKTAAAADLPDFKDMRIKFAEKPTVTEEKEFMENRALKAASKYRWENETTLVVHVLDAAAGARLIAESHFNSKIEAVEVSQIGKETYDALLIDNPGAFKAEKPENHAEITDAVDENRGILVQWNEGATREEIDAYAAQYGLRLVETDYRGAAGLVLYEAPKNDQQLWFVRTIASSIPEAFAGKIASLRPMREDAAAALEEESHGETAGPVSVEARSVHDEWVNFLNTQELITGKTLEPKQAMLIASLLRPVQPPPTEKSHPIIGRTAEQKRVIPVLTAPRGGVNSVMLVGPAGTGKTAIGEGMAQLIEDSEHADRLRIAGADGAATHLDIARLRGRWLVELDIDRLLASEDPVGTLLALIDLLPMLNDPDMRKGNRVILMLDEIQKLALDPAGKKILNALKVPIRNGKLSVLGTTTDKEWKEFFDADEALKSRFEKINIAEPTVEQTQQMLHGAKPHYEWVHDAEISDEALDAAARLADQFDKEEHNPRKSFKLVRSASELARPDNLRAAVALDIREGWGQLVAAVRSAKKELEKKGIASTIALPIETYNKIAELVEGVVALYDAHAKIVDGEGKVTTEVIKRRLAEVTGISAGQLTLGDQDSSKYLKMEEAVSARVINQDRAIKALANAIRRNKSGLADPHRPMGKFLFVGPTGVGKTHLVKELARFLFDDPEAYVRFDMSEFMEEHTYIRLVGAPPSYVGYGEGGQLTEAIRKKPYSVILLDEVEKAHPKVWNIFLQILDDGRLTDSEGHTVDFKNTVIVMTSNAGMKAVASQHYERLLTAKYLELAQLEETDAETRKALAALEISELEAEREEAVEKRAKNHDAQIAKARSALDGIADIRAYAEASEAVDRLEAARDQELDAVRAAFQKRIDAANARLEAPVDPAEAEARAEAIRADIAKIEKAWDDEIQLAIGEGVRQFFTPEFLNRLDEDPDSKAKWITFNRLNKENVKIIAGIEVKTFAKLLLERHDTELQFGDEVIDLLTNEGFSPVYGARPVKAAIEKYIVDPLAKWVLEQSEHGLDARGKKIVVTVENGTTKFEAFEREKVSPDKKNLQGIAHAMTEEVMHLVEELVADALSGEVSPESPVASEAFFDRALRAIGNFGKPGQEQTAPSAPAPLFAAGIETALKNAKVVAGENNNAKKADKSLRAGWRELAAEAEAAGYSAEAVALLNQNAGEPGEAWVKNTLRHAKEMAAKAGKEDPVLLTWEVSADAVTVVVRSPHTMDENEKTALKAHLTGTPPADLKEAQRRVDQLNLTATMLRDSNLLDLYRRASAIAGARIGYRSTAEGTEYVLILPKAPPAEATASRGSVPGRETLAAGPQQPKLTPHQIRERARTRPVFWKILHSENQSGPAIKIAASEGWARLTTPADLKEARSWIIEGKWANDDVTNMRLTEAKHKLQLAALVFKRWGTTADLPVLEKMARTYTSSSHYDIPAKQALIDAYAEVLARAGRDAALAAYARGTEEGNASENVKIAAQRALGKTGKVEDLPKLMSPDGKTVEPDALVDLLEREAPRQLAAYIAENWRVDSDGTRFKSLSVTQKKAVLKAVARMDIDPEGDLAELKQVIESKRGADRQTLYDAGEALAVLAQKRRLGANLERMLEEFMSNNTLNNYNDKWTVLLALLYTAQRVGGAELLPIIEAIMKADPTHVSSNYEQPHFETPYTWARIVVRTGLITQYLQKRRGPDGELQPSKIESMLASTNPMEVAAALHAVSLAQGGLGGHGIEGDLAYDGADQGPLSDLIELDTSAGSSSSGFSGGYMGGMYRRGPHGHDFDWGGRWDPMRHHLPPM